MKKADAIKLISKTFEAPFEREGFIRFIKELLNSFEPDSFAPRTGTYIREAFREQIHSLERIGVYEEADKRIDLLIVHLKKETSLERARTMQRNFVAGYLRGDYGSDSEKDAALVAFVSADPADWRFSLVKLEYALEENEKGQLKGIEKFTPARRWSFLVGKHEKSHTAQTRLVPILADDENSPTLEQLENAFDIESVSDEFFDEYRRLFIETKLALDEAILAAPKLKSAFEAQNVNSVDFAKKLLGQIIFLYYLQKKGWFGVPKGGAWGQGSKNFLRELFEGRHRSYQNFFNDILEPLFYQALRTDRSFQDHYDTHFQCKIPFLNGGLFDPIGEYDWVNSDLLLPNELFANEQVSNGDKGTGILDVFDRYNFTVREDEPFEKEVAIDPELLGKAYEKFNAIRPDNFEEYRAALSDGKRGSESQFNKKFGVYYTPREIVHYMCRQSLIQYLHTALNEKPDFQGLEISQAEIEDLILRGERIKENDARVMAAGRETSTYKFEMPPSIRAHAARLDEALATVKVCDPAVGSGAFPVGMMNEIVKARDVLRTYSQTSEVSTYHFKRACIENSLYGVDIDPGAVEIAKLRLWLSLIVDEEDPQNIRPLPNLDYKLMQGNSLLGLPEGALRNPETLAKLEEKKKAYFNETHPTRKNDYRKEIGALFASLVESARLFDPTLGEVNFDFQTHFSEVFQEKGGFDIVIENPPYGAKFSKQISDYLKKRYSTFSWRGESYMVFVEKSHELLALSGVCSFIIPDTYLNLGFTQALRTFLLKNSKINQIVLLPTGVFDSATVDTTLLFTQKAKLTSSFHKNNVLVKDFEKKFSDFNIKKTKREFLVSTEAWYEKDSFLVQSSKEEIRILNHIQRNKVLLGEIADLFYGIKAYQVGKGKPPQTKKIRTEKPFTSSVQKTKEFSPFYDGKHIGYYQLLWMHDNWIKYGKWLAEPRNPEKFDGEKILIRKIVSKTLIATYINDKSYSNTLLYVLKLYDPSSFPYKYILGILNSKLLGWYFRKRFQISSDDTFPQILIRDIVQFPIPISASSLQEEIISFVDEILDTKKSHPSADTSALEGQIDALVYELYGLTEEEIAIVEGRA